MWPTVPKQTGLNNEKTLSEASDDVKFGGIVFESEGFSMRTLPFLDPPPNLHIPALIRNRPYMAGTVLHRVALGTLGRSVGRVTFQTDNTAKAYLSGWVSQSGDDRYFISSSHNYNRDYATTPAVVSFALMWDGETPAPDEPPPVFYVQFEGLDTAAELLVWKFAAKDIPFLPPPLGFSRQPVVHDHTVSAGYCVHPTLDKLMEYYEALPLTIRKFATRPSVESAVKIFHPNSKVASPGEITQLGDVSGYTVLAVQASLYHGMSGGPVFLIDQQRVLGVCAQVGNTHTLSFNANTLLDITRGPAHAFLATYMQPMQ